MTRATLAKGYDISRVLKGGWQLAGGHGSIDASAALADMDRFVEAGITTFDCADIYTGVEELIGQWLRTRPAAASGVQVHTKYVPDLDRLAAHSRADVARGIERSLQRLGVDRIDVVPIALVGLRCAPAISTRPVARRAAHRRQGPHIG